MTQLQDADATKPAAGSAEPEHGPDQPAIRRALRRAALLTAGAGIAYGVLTIVAWYLLRQDRIGLAAAPDVNTYYEETGLTGSTIAGLYLAPFAAILFLWFIVSLRGWIRGTRQRRNMLISDLQLVSGVVFVSLFLVGASATATWLIAAESGSGHAPISALLALSGFGNTLMGVMGVRMAAIFVISTASLGMTTGVLPRWFNYVSLGFGLVLMLAPIVESTLIMAFPVWVIVLGTMLLYHLVRLPTSEVPGFARRYAERNATSGDAPELD